MVRGNDVGKGTCCIRRKRVMLDADLARLFSVSVSDIAEAVRRNPKRFPSDFAFKLSAAEVLGLRSGSRTGEKKNGRPRLPLVFTSAEVAMLTSMLKSKAAIQANIMIIRMQALRSARRGQGAFDLLRGSV